MLLNRSARFGKGFALAGLLFFALIAAAPQPLLACGWAGDGDSDDIEADAVGADGKALSAEEEKDPFDDPRLQLAMGEKFRLGTGVPVDLAKARFWYSLAARLGLAAAQNNLAAMFEQGLGGPGNLAKAAKWYQMAARQGEANAQHSLGIMYRDGRGVTRDQAKALKWIEAAAAGGHASAVTDLGMIRRGQSSPNRRRSPPE
jgi:TPR repeat protein